MFLLHILETTYIKYHFSSSWNRLNRGKDSIMYSLLVPMLSEPSIFLEDYHGFWWSTVHSDSSQNSFIFSITSGQYLHGQLTVFRCNSQPASLGRPDSSAFQIKSGWVWSSSSVTVFSSMYYTVKVVQDAGAKWKDFSKQSCLIFQTALFTLFFCLK